MNMKVIVNNVTKAGLKCETQEEKSPIVAFIARDHHNSEYFSKITRFRFLNKVIIV